ncbi:MAG: alkylmercury lyase [Thaumarchaeota archaeon]|nr:MAG: alkylmercury lyase [Nitrososphaerota archaeon]
MTAMSTLNNLADKIVNAMPKLGSGERRIAVGLYRLLAEGEPVSPERLAETLNLSGSTVRETLSRWPGVYYDDTRAVIGFGGLALSEMPHRFQGDGRNLHTWCAWDSLFIPGILGKTARVESTDPITNEKISLVVEPEGVNELEPTDTVVSFLAPSRGFDADVIQSFCHFVHFFGSRESGELWSSEHKGTLLLSVEQAHELGRLTNTRNFGEALAKP